jgi:hypothetical protein
MRVALCISGHLRSYTKTLPSIITNLIKKYNPDIFISTWSSPGFWSNNKSVYGVSNRCKIFDKKDFDKIKTLLKPKEFEIEELTEDLALRFIKEADHIISTRPQPPKYRWGKKQNIIGMYYKINKCNELKKKYENKHNFKYDLVIRTRPDIIINNCENLEPKKNTILIYNQGNDINFHIGDLFFAGPSDVMDRICGLYSNNGIKDIYHKTNCLYCSHDILLNAIDTYQINKIFLKFSFEIFNTPFGYLK